MSSTPTISPDHDHGHGHGHADAAPAHVADSTPAAPMQIEPATALAPPAVCAAAAAVPMQIEPATASAPPAVCATTAAAPHHQPHHQVLEHTSVAAIAAVDVPEPKQPKKRSVPKAPTEPREGRLTRAAATAASAALHATMTAGTRIPKPAASTRGRSLRRAASKSPSPAPKRAKKSAIVGGGKKKATASKSPKSTKSKSPAGAKKKATASKSPKSKSPAGAKKKPTASKSPKSTKSKSPAGAKKKAASKSPASTTKKATTKKATTKKATTAKKPKAVVDGASSRCSNCSVSPAKKSASPSPQKKVAFVNGDPVAAAAPKAKQPRPKALGKFLTKADALRKYHARLSMMAREDFATLHDRWISVYEPALRRHKQFAAGNAAVLGWTKVLAEVAADKGAAVLGVVPHYGKYLRPDAATTLKIFHVMPHCVDGQQETLFRHHAAHIGKIADLAPMMATLAARRVYVGKATAAECESPFSFRPSDRCRDEFWKAVCAVQAPKCMPAPAAIAAPAAAAPAEAAMPVAAPVVVASPVAASS